MRPWDTVIPQSETDRYAAAGLGGAGGFGHRAALLVIDVQYRTLGRTRAPIDEAMKDYRTACGEAGWSAVDHIAPLAARFRALNLPVLHPHVAPKDAGSDGGRLAGKITSIMEVDAAGYDFPPETAPRPGEILIPKKHPSAFFGTPLVSHLIDLGVDTLVVAGCTTSGCVRASVVDAFSLNFRVIVAEECVYDRAPTTHAVSLWDMNAKYADVMPLSEVLAQLKA